MAEQLQNGTYETQMVEEYELLTKRGKKRYINKLSSVDRLLTRALAQQLQKKYNQRFSQFSYAYQEGKSTYLAALQAAEYMKEGYMWAAELDVEKYFDSISLECLEVTMQELIEEEDVIECCKRFFRAKILRDGEVTVKYLGILQGSPLSPFLGNLYLHPLAVMLEEQGIAFVRFGDDITLWAKSRSEADQAMEFAKEQLEGRFHLQVNREKTRIYPAEKCELLGFVFEKVDDAFS